MLFPTKGEGAVGAAPVAEHLRAGETDNLAAPHAGIKLDLKAWRRAQLRDVKATSQYQSLTPTRKRLVDFLVMAHNSPDGGMFVKYENIGKTFRRKAPLGVEAVGKHMRAIVDAGVFEREYRGRTTGKAGRTSNRYRINPALSALARWSDALGAFYLPPIAMRYAVRMVALETELQAHVDALRAAVLVDVTLRENVQIIVQVNGGSGSSLREQSEGPSAQKAEGPTGHREKTYPTLEPAGFGFLDPTPATLPQALGRAEVVFEEGDDVRENVRVNPPPAPRCPGCGKTTCPDFDCIPF